MSKGLSDLTVNGERAGGEPSNQGCCSATSCGTTSTCTARTSAASTASAAPALSLSTVRAGSVLLDVRGAGGRLRGR